MLSVLHFSHLKNEYNVVSIARMLDFLNGLFHVSNLLPRNNKCSKILIAIIIALQCLLA